MRSCALLECPVAQSGQCLEGFDDLAQCPYFGREPNDIALPTDDLDDAGADDEALVGSVDLGWRAVHSGLQINSAEAARIMQRGSARVVVLGGDIESGKTTLLVSLYERLHDGPYCGYRFAGSRTLRAFEERCHHSRIESGLDVPRTERTSLSGSGFLHIRLDAMADVEPRTLDILFWDFTGEVFERARDSHDAVDRLEVLRAADHFALLVDGERLADRLLRPATRTDARTLLRRLIESGSLPPHAIVDVVITKWDEVVHRMGATEAEAQYVSLTDALTFEFKERVARLRVLTTAARPMSGDWDFAYGLESLLLSWIAEAPVRAYLPVADPTPDAGARAFDLYTVRGEE